MEMHTKETLHLFKQSDARGERSVPVDKIMETRNRNTSYMRYYNNLIRESEGRTFKIPEAVSKAEEEASKLYITEQTALLQKSKK